MTPATRLTASLCGQADTDGHTHKHTHVLGDALDRIQCNRVCVCVCVFGSGEHCGKVLRVRGFSNQTQRQPMSHIHLVP